MDDTVVVSNEHDYTREVSTLDSVSSGKKAWVGEEAAVIDTSSFKEDKKISASSALSLNLNEEKAIWGKDIYSEINPGEAAMLFTVYTVLQNCELTDEITVPEEALEYSTLGCSTLGLEQGDKLTVEQLLYSVILCSDVDSANVLALGVGGSMDAFVGKMNALAAELGCVDTKLQNAAGYYTASQYTTAYDLYLLVNRLMSDQRFADMIGSREYNFQYESADGSSVQKQLVTDITLISNETSSAEGVKLLGGIKGSSSYSGYHMVLLCENRSGDMIFNTVLGADSDSHMNSQMKRITKKIK